MKPLLTLHELLNKLTHLKLDKTTQKLIKDMQAKEVKHITDTISIEHVGENLYTLTKLN